MTLTYSEGTKVPVEKSEAEIRKTLERFGADGVQSGFETLPDRSRRCLLGFRLRGKIIRFEFAEPGPDDERFRFKANGDLRSSNQTTGAWQSYRRQLWRALALGIKAKLAFIDAGVRSIEEEFLCDIVMPDGATVGSHLLPAVESAYASGTMPPLLPYTPRPPEKKTQILNLNA